MTISEREIELKKIKDDIKTVEESAKYWFEECTEAQKRNDNSALESAKRHYQMKRLEVKTMRNMMNRMLQLF